jgi:tetratricopeptide (TPR) repeat protein
LFAVRSVHIHSGWQVGAIVLIGAIAVTTVMLAFNNRLSEVTAERKAKPLSKGSSYNLDVVILPFAPTQAEDAACKQFAQNLSISMADMADSTTKSPSNTLATTTGIVIWKPEQVDFGTPTPTEARENWMAKFASTYEVDVVMYGTVDCGGNAGGNANNTISVSPQFYVAPGYFKHAPELIGSYDFGAFSRTINKTSDSIALDEFRQELLGRANAIVALGRGFEYYARDNYKDYLSAAGVFEAVLSSDAVQDPRGQAMLHYMLGNAYMRASSNDCDDVLPDILKQAEANYLMAVDIEPEFASAYVGLGSIMSQWALNSTPDADHVREFLQRSEDFYQKALAARIQPINANVATRVALSRAQANVIEHDLLAIGETELLDTAESLLNTVISTYLNAGENASSLRSTTAHAYSLLGDVNFTREDMSGALDAYYKAAALATDAKLRTDISLRIADMTTEAGDACEAALQLQTAVNTLCVADRTELVVRAQDAQFYCKASFDVK